VAGEAHEAQDARKPAPVATGKPSPPNMVLFTKTSQARCSKGSVPIMHSTLRGALFGGR
jgi:hypothetical protein